MVQYHSEWFTVSGVNPVPSADEVAWRVRQVCPLDRSGMSLRAFADEAGVSQPTITRVRRADECAPETVRLVVAALDRLGVPLSTSAGLKPDVPVRTSETDLLLEPTVEDVTAVVHRGINSPTQQQRVDALTHLLVGRPGVRINRLELIGALVAIQNEQLDVSVLELLRDVLRGPNDAPHE